MPLPDFSEWEEFYSQGLITKSVFRRARGFPLWDQKNPQFMDVLGSAQRNTMPKGREIVNESFLSYLDKHGVDFVAEYRMVQPNIEASLKSLWKYNKPQPVFTAEQRKRWDKSGVFTERHFLPYMAGSDMIDLETAKRMLNKQSAAGFPISTMFADKTSWFNYDKDDLYFMNFWDELKYDEMKMRPIWTCAQKVELRSVQKLLENNIRVFTASPLEHSLALNIFCWDMNNRFYQSHLKTWSAVGMTKFMGVWDQLYQKLQRFFKGWALDVSQWDSSCFRETLEGQAQLRWSFLKEKWKTSDNRTRFFNLYDHIINSVIVLENGFLVQKFTGNPSGSANTVVDNTMILFRLLAYAWITIMGDDASYEDFMENVFAVLYGDDNTFSVHERVRDRFNAKSIAEVFASVGFKVTTDDWEARPIIELDFLSNGFRYDQGIQMVVPVPETNKVLSSLLYGSGDADIRWHFLRACNLRNDSWGNLELRYHLREYLQDLLRERMDDFVGEVNDVRVSDILNLYKTDHELSLLYSGYPDLS
jgi:hypothetical protein